LGGGKRQYRSGCWESQGAATMNIIRLICGVECVVAAARNGLGVGCGGGARYDYTEEYGGQGFVGDQWEKLTRFAEREWNCMVHRGRRCWWGDCIGCWRRMAVEVGVWRVCRCELFRSFEELRSISNRTSKRIAQRRLDVGIAKKERFFGVARAMAPLHYNYQSSGRGV